MDNLFLALAQFCSGIICNFWTNTPKSYNVSMDATFVSCNCFTMPLQYGLPFNWRNNRCRL